MSLTFNDTTTRRGIVQIYEKEAGLNRDEISGNTNKLKDFTADANLAFDDFVAIAIPESGKWQYDDTNHTDYPIIKTNLVLGQRDYTFFEDGTGNIVLDIHKVFVKDSGGVYHEIYPVDPPSDSQEDTVSLTDGINVQGLPYRYDKMGNGILLDQIPSYNSTLGLMIYISREPSYFTYNDSTKVPGVPGLFHEYFAINPAHKYARRKKLSNVRDLERARSKMESDIRDYFGRRSRDERTIIRGRKVNPR